MTAIFAFKCRYCGEVHEGSPSVAFDSPWQYSTMSAEQKSSLGKLSSDLCTITDGDGQGEGLATIRFPLF